jgi:hypothetical protein
VVLRNINAHHVCNVVRGFEIPETEMAHNGCHVVEGPCNLTKRKTLTISATWWKSLEISHKEKPSPCLPLGIRALRSHKRKNPHHVCHVVEES